MKGKRLVFKARRKLLFYAVGLLLVLIDAGLTYTSYKRVAAILLRLSPTPDPNVEDVLRAFRWGALTNSVAKHPRIQASCLRRTLAQWWVLRWLGVPSDVRIGVNTTAGHAWLEHHGYIVNDHPEIVKQFPIIYTEELTPERLARIV
jgi:hypothetical protein